MAQRVTEKWEVTLKSFKVAFCLTNLMAMFAFRWYVPHCNEDELTHSD